MDSIRVYELFRLILLIILIFLVLYFSENSGEKTQPAKKQKGNVEWTRISPSGYATQVYKVLQAAL
jgi:hypothetical protein